MKLPTNTARAKKYRSRKLVTSERFSDRPFVVVDPESEVIASPDAPYAELGRLVIEGDADEVTVCTVEPSHMATSTRFTN